MLNFAGLRKKVEYWTGNFPSLEKRLVKEMEWLDFIYLDHDVEYYFDDIRLLEKSGLMKHGTTIVANSILYPGAPDYRMYISEDKKYVTKQYGSELQYRFPVIMDIVSVS